VEQKVPNGPQARQTHGQSRLTSPHRLGRWGYDPVDLGHGRLPLDCPSRIGADQRLSCSKALGRRAHVRLADGVAPIGETILLETFIYLAMMIRLMVKRLAKLHLFKRPQYSS